MTHSTIAPETHVMVKLATLGTAHNAVILSIGAVKFDPWATTNGTGSTDRFHVGIDPVTCEAHSLKIDAATVMWWLEPKRASACAALLKHQQLDLATALEGFAMWYGPAALPIWGNGATFDNVILRSAYAATGLECPWEYTDDRCYRTMKNLAPAIEPWKSVGVAHNALEDAARQAEHLQRLIFGLGIDP